MEDSESPKIIGRVKLPASPSSKSDPKHNVFPQLSKFGGSIVLVYRVPTRIHVHLPNKFTESEVFLERTQEIILFQTVYYLLLNMNISAKDRTSSSKIFYLSSWQTLKEHYDSITIHCFNFRELHHEINPVEFIMTTNYFWTTIVM